jgi:hypothetical protein
VDTVSFNEGKEISGDDFTKVGRGKVGLQMEEDNVEDIKATMA